MQTEFYFEEIRPFSEERKVTGLWLLVGDQFKPHSV